MQKVLVVEDSSIATKIIRHIAKQDLNFTPIFASSFAQARECYEQHKDDLFAGLIDLTLPDAPDGEVVDFMLDKGLPTIVLTGTFSEERRERLLAKGIVDYVTKEGRYSYQYAIGAINRLQVNQSVKVLVVEDSNTSRKLICGLLRRHLYHVLEASNGIEAIKVLLEHTDIKLLITDYNMPQMDGFELVKNIRSKYEKYDLVIIGLSAEGEKSLSARFIKVGANDFLSKPFNPEELYCRVNHNIDALQLIDQIKQAANRDYLTGLYNRRYFFSVGAQLYQQTLDDNKPLALGVIDFDHFKQVNDDYGHDFGDYVLKRISQLFESTFERFLVARAGGEEFFVLLPGMTNNQAVAYLDKVRTIVAQEPFDIGEEDIFITISVGVSNNIQEGLKQQITLADSYLYRAKEAGRNMVIGDD